MMLLLKMLRHYQPNLGTYLTSIGPKDARKDYKKGWEEEQTLPECQMLSFFLAK